MKEHQFFNHKITVLGAGAWGTAIAQRLTNPVTLWSRNQNVVQSINQNHINSVYLANILLKSEGLIAADHLNHAIHENTQVVIIATPLNQLESILIQIKNKISELNKKTKPKEFPYIICLSKGLNQSHQELPFETFLRVFSSEYEPYFYDLIGPSFAQEVATNKPFALELVGHKNEKMKQELLPLLNMEQCRLYVHEDRIGAEMAVAIKNVLAIATGICDGLELGDNARAALITRGLQEMIRLIDAKKLLVNTHTKLNSDINSFSQTLQTVLGLSGIGDVLLTCTGGLSRNRQTGLLLAQGKNLDEILTALGHVAEGVHTAKSAYEFSQKNHLVTPIIDVIYAILYENIAPKTAVSLLFKRPLAY